MCTSEEKKRLEKAAGYLAQTPINRYLYGAGSCSGLFGGGFSGGRRRRILRRVCAVPDSLGICRTTSYCFMVRYVALSERSKLVKAVMFVSTLLTTATACMHARSGIVYRSSWVDQAGL